MGERAYLDHNATTPLRPSAAEAMARAFSLVGNPASVHAEGRAARAAIEDARRQMAACVGADARDVVFTSGATEALNTLLRLSPDIRSRQGAITRIVRSATEHSAVVEACGGTAEIAPVDSRGLVDLDALHERLADDRAGVALLALQLANGETGVVQPIAEGVEVARRADALVVCDAVAAFGKIDIDMRALGVDALVLAAHKFGGPKGVGAIILHGDRLRIENALIKGGGQESRRRSGTENVAGIVGMAAAAREAAAERVAEAARLRGFRDKLLAGLRRAHPDLVVFGEEAPRLPNTVNIGAPGLKSETAVIAFDLAGVAVSSGSACSSGKVARSHVLEAMGIPSDLAAGALRFSLGWTSTEADIDRTIAVYEALARSSERRAA